MRLNLALLAKSDNKTYKNIFSTHELAISSNEISFSATGAAVFNRAFYGRLQIAAPIKGAEVGSWTFLSPTSLFQ